MRRSPQRRRPLTPRSGVMRKKKSRWPFSAVAWRQLRGLCTAVRHLPHAAGHSASVARWPGNYSVAFSRGPAAAGFWSRASQCLMQSTTRSLASSAQNAAEAVPLSFFDAARRLCVSMVRAIIGPGGGREPAAGVAPAVSSVPASATGGMSRGATTKKRNVGSNLLRRFSNLASLPLNIHLVTVKRRARCGPPPTARAQVTVWWADTRVVKA